MGDVSNQTPNWLNSATAITPPQAAGVTDVVTQLQAIVRQLTAINQTLMGRFTIGSFTATSGTTSVITQPAVKANSIVTLSPTNSAASTFLASHGYFITITAGTSFTVTFSGSAAGTETFNYIINTPT